MEWALLMRVMPILLVAVGVVVVSTGLQLIPRCARYFFRERATNLDSRQLVEDAREIPRSQVHIQHGKAGWFDHYPLETKTMRLLLKMGMGTIGTSS